MLNLFDGDIEYIEELTHTIVQYCSPAIFDLYVNYFKNIINNHNVYIYDACIANNFDLAQHILVKYGPITDRKIIIMTFNNVYLDGSISMLEYLRTTFHIKKEEILNMIPTLSYICKENNFQKVDRLFQTFEINDDDLFNKCNIDLCYKMSDAELMKTWIIYKFIYKYDREKRIHLLKKVRGYEIIPTNII